MNVEWGGVVINVGFAMGAIVTALSLAWGIHSARQTRGLPLTREEQQAKQIDALTKQVMAQDEQITMLLDDRMRDRERIRALELRIAELERERDHYSAPPRGARRVAGYTPKKLTASN